MFMMGDPRVLRFLQLLTNCGFVREVPVTVNGVRKKLFHFGPQGTLLRRNIIKQWWDAIVLQQPNTFCVECPPLTIHKTDDLNTSGKLAASSPSPNEGHLPAFSLTDHSVLRSSLTPDCLSGYLASLKLSNGQLPVSAASIGQCYNVQQEQTQDDHSKLLKNGLFDTGLLLQHYTPPVSVAQTYDFLLRTRLRWWRKFASNPSKLNSSSVTTDTTVEGSNGHTAITYAFPWGTEPVETIRNHGDSPVHTMESETRVSHQGVFHQKTFHPHLIECQTTVEQCMSVFLTDAFRERQLKRQTDAQQSQDPKLVLHLHPLLSPYQVALSVTGSRSREVRALAEHIAGELREKGIWVFNQPGNSSSMESQYRRNDELGIPYTVVLSDQTLDRGEISVRNRDTGLKQQQHVSTLQALLLRNLHATDPD